MAGEEQSLRDELALFERHRREWLGSHPGEFVVIVGTTIIGFHPDYESGFRAGLAAAGLGRQFLLKQVWAEEPVYLLF